MESNNRSGKWKWKACGDQPKRSGEFLLEILESRDQPSTLFSAQLPIGYWHQITRDPTLADAILDRLIHNAHEINLKGESMRKTKRLD